MHATIFQTPNRKAFAMNRLSAHELLERIELLRKSVEHDARDTLKQWARNLGGMEDLPGALNLAAYLALRHHDISDLQPALADYGLSTLGRSESHVLGSLQALAATLARIAGVPGHRYPPPDDRISAERALLDAQLRFFGPAAIAARTRIMVTLPSESATDQALVRSLIKAGMTCARINCAHDNAEMWQAMADMVRAEVTAAGVECRILMDIAGPKCRIETVHAADKIRLFRGDRIVIVRDMANAMVSDAVIATINFPEILQTLVPGHHIWINDGKIGTRVVSSSDGRVELEVFSARTKGERLRPEKGVNFPDTELHLAPLTPKDHRDLDVIASIADVVGFSFVQRPEDMRLLRGELSKRSTRQTPLPIVMKIETPVAVRNLPRLIIQGIATGPVAVMIARGDLAVEIGFARLSEIQEEIMWLCEAAHVPVIWATEVLDRMVSNGMPSRAEATDAAMAQRAECVMLNKGPFLAEGMRFLGDVLLRMDRHHAKKTARLGPLHSWPLSDLGLTST